MKKDELEALRALEAKALPAPWEARACSVVTPRAGFDMDGLPRPEEADLIAATRNALPRLMDEREMLLEALREAEHTIGVEMFPAFGGRMTDLYGVDVANEHSMVISEKLASIHAAIAKADS